MQVRVLGFGVMKDWLGASPVQVDLAEGATVAELLENLRTKAAHAYPAGNLLQGIAMSVNAEYADQKQILRDGDEVGLLPPVSGGCADSPPPDILTLLTREPIAADKMLVAAKQGADGAVVAFDGIVRNNTRGRQTLYLDYEAYEEMAAKQMDRLAAEACVRFGVRHVSMVHRLGRLAVGETSVLIVVASADRAAAYDASRWLIDSLKKSVPIWKKETFVDGAVWAAGEAFPPELALGPEGSHAS